MLTKVNSSRAGSQPVRFFTVNLMGAGRLGRDDVIGVAGLTATPIGRKLEVEQRSWNTPPPQDMVRPGSNSFADITPKGKRMPTNFVAKPTRVQRFVFPSWRR